MKNLLTIPVFLALWLFIFFISVMTTGLFALKTQKTSCVLDTMALENEVILRNSLEERYCKLIVYAPYIAATILSGGITFFIFKKSLLRKK